MEPRMAVKVFSGGPNGEWVMADRLYIRTAVKEFTVFPKLVSGQVVLSVTDDTDGVDNMTVSPAASNTIYLR